MNIVESDKIHRLYLDLREYERDLNSISPKMVDMRNKIKDKIRSIQLKINEIRNSKNIPL